MSDKESIIKAAKLLLLGYETEKVVAVDERWLRGFAAEASDETQHPTGNRELISRCEFILNADHARELPTRPGVFIDEDTAQSIAKYLEAAGTGFACHFSERILAALSK